MCECAACGEVFTSLTAFDQHQDVDYKRTPADAGLIQRGDGRWHIPQNAAGAARLKNLRAERAGVG